MFRSEFKVSAIIALMTIVVCMSTGCQYESIVTRSERLLEERYGVDFVYESCWGSNYTQTTEFSFTEPVPGYVHVYAETIDGETIFIDNYLDEIYKGRVNNFAREKIEILFGKYILHNVSTNIYNRTKNMEPDLSFEEYLQDSETEIIITAEISEEQLDMVLMNIDSVLNELNCSFGCFSLRFYVVPEEIYGTLEDYTLSNLAYDSMVGTFDVSKIEGSISYSRVTPTRAND